MMAAHHLEGKAALGKYLQQLASTKRDKKHKLICIFDFDRTLTNGTSFEAGAPLDKRVRGGKHTLLALEKLKAAGVEFYIVTARSPRPLVITQLQESLRKAQKELSKLFVSEGEPKLVKFNGVDLALGGRIYACGYEKAAGVAHILVEQAKEKDVQVQVHFFDDAVVNAALVIKTLQSILKGADSGLLVDRIDLHSCWWDPFSEETGKSASMVAVHSETSDFNFHDYLQSDLEIFGISNEERIKRRNVYLKEEKEQGRKPPSSLDEKTNPKKMKNVNETHAGLASFLEKRK